MYNSYPHKEVVFIVRHGRSGVWFELHNFADFDFDKFQQCY